MSPQPSWLGPVALLPHNLIGSGRCEKDDVGCLVGGQRAQCFLIHTQGRGPAGHGSRSRKGCCRDQVCRPEQGRAGSTQKAGREGITHDVLAMHGDIQDSLQPKGTQQDAWQGLGTEQTSWQGLGAQQAG